MKYGLGIKDSVGVWSIAGFVSKHILVFGNGYSREPSCVPMTFIRDSVTILIRGWRGLCQMHRKKDEAGRVLGGVGELIAGGLIRGAMKTKACAVNYQIRNLAGAQVEEEGP